MKERERKRGGREMWLTKLKKRLRVSMNKREKPKKCNSAFWKAQAIVESLS